MSFFKLNDDSLLASLDLGSYGIRCAVFKKSKDFPFELLAFTEIKTQGLDSAQVLDFDRLSLALSEVLSLAEEQSKGSFSEIWLGFSPPFHSFISKGMVALPAKEVRAEDMELAIQTACSVPLPEKHISLHQRPNAFYVDSQKEVWNPLSLSGLRLETEVQLLSVSDFYLKDITKALKVLGYKPRSFFHNLLSFGEFMTSFEQKTHLVCLCDIGHKSTRGIVYKNHKIESLFSIPLGGFHWTQVLAKSFQLSIEQAEQIKHKYGQVLAHFSSAEESIELKDSNQYLSRKQISQCLESLFEKLLEEIKDQIPKNDFKDMSFVFTGASAYIEGFKPLAEFYLGQPVFYPHSFYGDYKKDQNGALIQQACLTRLLNQTKKKAFSPFSFLKEMF